MANPQLAAKVHRILGRLLENETAAVAPRADGKAITLDKSGVRGHWITTKGGARVFLPSSAEEEAADLDALKRAAEGSLDKVTITTKDGRQVTQYVYPEGLAEKKAEYKFARVQKLLSERDKIEASLRDGIGDPSAGDPMSKDAIEKTAVLLILKTGIRAGDEEGRTGGGATYAASTLEKRHVTVEGDTVHLKFRGKAGVNQDVSVEDKQLAGAMRALLGSDSNAAADKLFQHGTPRKVVTRQGLIGQMKVVNKHYKLHDLRTAKAQEVGSATVDALLKEDKPILPTVSALAKAKDIKKALRDRKALAKSYIDRVANAVSGQLGNKPAVALGDYTNPALIEHMLTELGFAQPVQTGKGKFDVK